jgi:hypothetical protein
MKGQSSRFASFPPALLAFLDTGAFDSASGILAAAATADLIKPSSEQIADLAYRIWDAEGRPDGRDVSHWLEAEARLSALFSQTRMIRESTAW